MSSSPGSLGRLQDCRSRYVCGQLNVVREPSVLDNNRDNTAGYARSTAGWDWLALACLGEASGVPRFTGSPVPLASVPVWAPPPPFEGEGEFALWHFGEDPGLWRFVPHVAATNENPEPFVWAVDPWHSPLFWYPCDCPLLGQPGDGGSREPHDSCFDDVAL